MRAAIQARLVSELPAIAGRCYEAHEPTSATVKPFATICLKGRKQGAPWLGCANEYEIALYGQLDEAAQLEQLTEDAIAALADVRLTPSGSGPAFTCRYVRAGGEAVDADRQALVQRVRLIVYAVGVEEEVEGPNDPFLAALCAWTRAEAGAGWNVYAGRWPQSYEQPAILWRQGQIAVSGRSASTAEVTRRMIGHVLAHDDEARLAMIGRLAGRLALAVKLPVASPGEGAVVVGAVAGHCDADGLITGQLEATLRQLVRQPSESGPLIREVAYQGGFE